MQRRGFRSSSPESSWDCGSCSSAGSRSGSPARPPRAQPLKAAAPPAPAVVLEDFSYEDSAEEVTLTVSLAPFFSSRGAVAADGPRAVMVEIGAESFSFRVGPPGDPRAASAVFAVPALRAAVVPARCRVRLTGDRVVAVLAKRSPGAWPGGVRRLRGPGAVIEGEGQLGFEAGSLPTNEQLRGLDVWRVN